MSIVRGNRPDLCALAVLLALAGSGHTASAQGLFGALFGGFGDFHQRPRVSAPAYSSPDDRYPEFQSRNAPETGIRGSGTNCVRLCDGRYFPVPSSANGVRLDPVKACNALCPAAATKVFQGSNMEYARASDGTRYAALENAFVFRDKIVSDCSCTGQGPGGLAQIDVESDPTLRAGDVVVTASGPTVFRGSNQFPYKTADFTPIDDYGRLNKSLRDKLSAMQVNTSVKPTLPPQKLEASGGRPVAVQQPPQPQPQRRQVQTSDTRPRARAFPLFPWW